MTTKRVAGTLVLSMVLSGGASLALSQGGGMAGMKGMDMGHEIERIDGIAIAEQPKHRLVDDGHAPRRSALQLDDTPGRCWRHPCSTLPL